MKLLTPGISNAKIAKGEGEYTTYILHLAPANLSGYNVCPAASEGCKKACLNSAGRGRFSSVQEARIRKTKLFFENRSEFMRLLVKDIEAAVRKAKRTGQKLAIRLNGTSDIDWENYTIRHEHKHGIVYANVFEMFSDVQFYDYVKDFRRLDACSKIPNYHLTLSRSESNDVAVKRFAKAGYNIAVVFEKLPESWYDIPVIDGTQHDLRFLDPKNVIVGLVAKGKAKSDGSGFVEKLQSVSCVKTA